MFKRSPSAMEETRVCSIYSSGLSLKETAHRANLCISTVTKILRKHQTDRRIRTTRGKPTEAIDDSSLITFKKKWDSLDSTVKGTVCENYVKTKLSELGFDVWEPSCQNHRTDLVILNGSKITRIQVKAGTYDLATKCFRANFSRHRRGGKRTEYEHEDVDFFTVYCPGLPSSTIYVIPESEITRRNRCPRLFPHRDRLLVCSPFSLEKFVNDFELLR
jgi:hypothetical protein